VPAASTWGWQSRAACRDVDPELFFPVGDSGPALLQIAEAKAVCHACPVTAKCLAHALDAGHRDGVWGGRSADERSVLRRARIAVESSTPGALITVRICDRCGDVTVDPDPCRCTTTHTSIEVHRRHLDAVARARATDALKPPSPARRAA
jgi:WhiB family redox-sensing transcriptional regulator